MDFEGEEHQPYTREEDVELLGHLHMAVSELDSLTDRLRRVIEEHEFEDLEDGQEQGHA